ncbi:MFS transporter [Gemmatimonas sp.]
MQTMAVGWLALELSNSAFVVGLVASVGALPIVLFSMHAGALVDRATASVLCAPRRRCFGAGVVLWLITLLGFVNIPLLLLLQFVQGMASAVEIPARQSMVISWWGATIATGHRAQLEWLQLARVVGPAGRPDHRGIRDCVVLRGERGEFRVCVVGIGEDWGGGGARVGGEEWELREWELREWELREWELLEWEMRVGTTGVGTTGVGTTGVRGAGIGEVLRETSASAMDGLRYLLRRGARSTGTRYGGAVFLAGRTSRCCRSWLAMCWGWAVDTARC